MVSVRLLAEDRVWRVVALAGAVTAFGSGRACCRAGARVAAAAPESAAGPSVPRPPPPLLPLTGEEERLRQEVQGEVGEIAELGPRSLAHSWNLHSATDYLARKLETYG